MDDFAKLGFNIEAADVAQDEAAICKVPSDCWDSLGFFLSLQSQWNVGIGFSGVAYFGLDYAAVAALMQVMKVRKRKRMMKDIQIMEAAALPILNGSTPEPEDRP